MEVANPVRASCWEKVKACLSHKETTQCSKAIFWNVGAGVTVLIPIVTVSTGIMGSMFFMGINEIVKHPDSVFMKKEASRQFVTSRTWKHITAGVFFSGISWGLGGLALSNGLILLAGASWLGGMAGAFGVTYADPTCVRRPAPAGYQQVQLQTVTVDPSIGNVGA